ncbi:DNA-binding MarR family transcriptional regulator [Arthrobacter sp. JUb119]|uniref:MarR family winged helix-turn-helix transcriptional regulator n=1 Tax=Micrococcaceae TaxID=1268 RepID=UPI000CFCD27C|nr:MULTISPECIES: MarR family transcriptional regulator [unclassified Arthrobacter]MCS3492156.1 DNA-binding MarR family transcriptional regulator [Arthrobacter sp. JUb119]PQZ86512.1 MarR family transcriptional regulator [Arthrobacter sp. MYb222]PRB77894.1 MarR family transcriptional regulator [Arthrobacter sp. MYb214]
MAAKELPTMYGLSESDPGQDLIKRAGIAPANLEQIDRIMAEMGRMRQIERRIMRSSQQFMKLNETDMRAIRKMISAKHAGQSVTPGALSQYLGISSASVTKMIDRLEAHGHVRRTRHPTDRRSQCVEVTEETHLAAREQVGRHHAKRFEVANAMSPEERDVVIRFLAGTSDALESSLDSTTAGEAD